MRLESCASLHNPYKRVQAYSRARLKIATSRALCSAGVSGNLGVARSGIFRSIVGCTTAM